MHRRARHLNPRDAGASLVLDSRFISGLADADPVGTWTDRSGVTGSVTASGSDRPSYEVAEQGGQPVVRFSGSNALSGSAAALPTGANARMLIVAGRKADTGNVDVLAGWGNAASGNVGFGLFADSSEIVYGWFYSADDFSTGLAVSSPTVFSLTWDGTTTRSFANGTTGATSSAVLNTGSDLLHIAQNAAASVNRLTGDLYQITVIDRESAPLRRRLEHAAAFSFKIPCS